MSVVEEFAKIVELVGDEVLDSGVVSVNGKRRSSRGDNGELLEEISHEE